VTIRYVPLVTGANGTWVARPVRTIDASHLTVTALSSASRCGSSLVTTTSWPRARRARGGWIGRLQDKSDLDASVASGRVPARSARSVLPASVHSRPHVATEYGGDVRHRFVDGNCRLVMHEGVDDRGDQLGPLVLSGTSQDEGHVEETARLVEVSVPIGLCFCGISSALVGNVDSSCGGSAGLVPGSTPRSIGAKRRLASSPRSRSSTLG